MGNKKCECESDEHICTKNKGHQPKLTEMWPIFDWTTGALAPRRSKSTRDPIPVWKQGTPHRCIFVLDAINNISTINAFSKEGHTAEWSC